MATEVIAAISGALITGIFAIIVAYRDDIAYLLQRKTRVVDGTWEGESYALSSGPIDSTKDDQGRPAEVKYTATLKQKGNRVTGTMVMTQTLPGLTLYEHVYKGYLKGEYFIYNLTTVNPGQFRLSTALLHIDNSGLNMRGYWVANSGSEAQGRTFVGYTVMKRRA